MKDVSLKQRIGEQYTGFFIIRTIEMRRKKSDNAPYLVLELGYSQGRIWSNVWENTDAFLGEYAEGEVVKIQGIIEKYRDQTQISMMRIRKAVATDNVHPEDLLPHYPGDISVLKKKLQDVIDSISHEGLREICTKLLLEGEFSDRFMRAPGGKLWHHGYSGGLLEHTVSVAELAQRIAVQYPDVDPDILCAGALLHDIGKVDAYAVVPYIDYSDEGRLIGHVVKGYERVQAAIRSVEKFPQEIAKQLLHLILSHHGLLENASPVVPMTLEAIILHQIDQIDSQVNAWLRIRNEQTPRKKWSDYVNIADRFFYFGDSGEPV